MVPVFPFFFLWFFPFASTVTSPHGDGLGSGGRVSVAIGSASTEMSMSVMMRVNMDPPDGRCGVAISRVYGVGGTVPQGATQAMPLAQMLAQVPVDQGTHADPAANPNAWQSLSRWQAAQSLTPTAVVLQKLLSAVVRTQTHAALLQGAGAG